MEYSIQDIIHLAKRLCCLQAKAPPFGAGVGEVRAFGRWLNTVVLLGTYFRHIAI